MTGKAQYFDAIGVFVLWATTISAMVAIVVIILTKLD
ncbi:hypothetical protein FHS94_001312 [Sphingomonas aerophila]|uniref:Uncharacterized protein n=1 Tax=Sphingomonas aerophila TaxID=1344948 RepID=A0A7W9BC98_9SPHN|nr:hypothetical protein [Sphingomonas aerophila]